MKEQHAADGKDSCNIPPIPVHTPLCNMTLLLPTSHPEMESISTPLEPAQLCDLLWPMEY